MNINLLELLDNKHTAVCLMSEIKQPGPWTNKKTTQEKLNCFLNFKLSGLGRDAMDIRGYLSNEDREDIWMKNLKDEVLPFIDKECYNVA